MNGDPYAKDDVDAVESDEAELSPAEKILWRERFSQARFDVGYIREDVDVLVEALRSAYAETGAIDGIIETHTLHTGGFREGYEVTEFEEWLTELVEATGTTVGERPAVIAAESPVARRTSRRAKAEAAPASAITEQRGLLSRLRRSH